ncbi:MAG: ATP-grasp ribosomal peptide maturase [Pseudonocardiales bacterium]
MTVLVIASELDRTVDGVVAALAHRGVPVFRADCSWFPQRLTLDAELRDGRWQGYLATVDRRVELAQVRSIWYRNPAPFVFPAGMSQAELQHAEREARIGLGGVLMSLPAAHVNHPHRVAAATKPWQLTKAAGCGLSVPPTRITNTTRAAREFVAVADGEVVCKLFANRVIEDGGSKVGHTRLLTAADLADLRGFDTTAHQLQRFVDKHYDLRVVMVGERLFPVAIHPTSAAARVDFRSDYRALRHEIVDVPAIVENGIRVLLAELGLVFGCLDFVVDQSGEHHYLEVNPTGQFGWLEGTVGVPVTAALAELLARPLPAATCRESA